MGAGAIRRKQERVAFRNSFGTLFNDDVIAPNGTAGRYLRWCWSEPGVVVIAETEHGVLLLPTYRYPIGASSLELPRGGRLEAETLENAARREAYEEAGVELDEVRHVATLYADSGLIENELEVMHGKVDREPSTQSTGRPEAMESIAEQVWLNADQLRNSLRAKRIRCAITIAALTMAECLIS